MRAVRRFSCLAAAPASPAILAPDEILLLDDGSAVACYGGEPLLVYATLEELLARHALGREALDERAA